MKFYLKIGLNEYRELYKSDNHPIINNNICESYFLPTEAKKIADFSNSFIDHKIIRYRGRPIILIDTSDNKIHINKIYKNNIYMKKHWYSWEYIKINDGDIVE